MTESSAGSSGFDPRFDPAFQPGYDQRVRAEHPEVSARLNLGDAELDDAELRAADPADADVRSILGQGQNARTADRWRVPTDADAAVSAGAAQLSALEHSEPAAPALIRIREPFLVALWAVSVLFVIAGVGLLRYMTDRLNALTTAGGGDASDYSLLRTFEIGAPLLIVLGLGTATGTLFLLAARRHRRAS